MSNGREGDGDHAIASDELSWDARCLLSTWFSYGDKTKVTVGGAFAVSVLSERGAAAITELVAKGYATAEVFNHTGRMTYTGTDKCRGGRLAMADMELHGNWSPTMPNPAKGGSK